MAKPIGPKNPIFEQKFIEELQSMFSLYADPRQRRAEMRNLLLTASTLGLDQKYEFVYRVITEIDEPNHSNALDFEGFLTELTNKIVHIFLINRETPSLNKEDKLILYYSIDMERDN